MGATTSEDSLSTTDLERLTWAVAEDGPTAHEHALAALARTARASGVTLVAADVLSDPRAAAIARSRALSHVVAGLARTVAAGSPRLHAVA